MGDEVLSRVESLERQLVSPLERAARERQRFAVTSQRYFHDVTMYRQHISSQQQDFAVRNGAYLLGAERVVPETGRCHLFALINTSEKPKSS